MVTATSEILAEAGLSEKLFPDIKVEFFFSVRRLRLPPEKAEYFQATVK